MNIDKIINEYADEYVFDKNGHLFSNNNDEAGNAFKCCKDAAHFGYELGEKMIAQERLSAYYAGFNQAHYSHIHPEHTKPKDMIVAAKEWYEKTYKKIVHIHHSGNVVENEGDELFAQFKKEQDGSTK